MKKYFIITLLTFSCTTTRPAEQQSSFEIDGANEYENQATSKSTKAKVPQYEASLTYKHPASPTAWHTRKLIMVEEQPPKESIQECATTIDTLTKDALTLQQMDEASAIIKLNIASSTKTYHWCFYQLMVSLDLKLEKDMPFLQDKKELFLTKMRGLWALARALDAKSPSAHNDYMIYLRKRYLDISLHEFGRNLETIDRDSLLVTAGKNGKSAAEFADP